MSSDTVVLPSNMPVGFRFSPTEEEVIDHYLRLKIVGMDSEVDPVIAEVEFCKWDPWELPRKSKIESDDQVWWFFSRRDYKNTNSKRSNRKTKTGFWKITGTEIKIKGRTTKGFIGGKRVLVFHEGPAPGKGTGWVMHEYYTEPDNIHSSQRAYVVCRLEFKTGEKGQKAGRPDYVKGEPSGEIMPVLENPIVSAAIPMTLYSPDSRLIDEADESEEYLTEFAYSLIVDPEENDCGSSTNNVFNNSSLRDSSKRSYFEDDPVSSDIDMEGINEEYIQTSENSSSFGLPGGTKKIRHMQMVKITPSETVHTSSGDKYKQEIIVSLYDQFTDEDASSDGVTAYVEEINCLNLVTDEDAREFNCFDSVTEEGPYVFVERRGRQKRIQPQKKASSAAISGNQARGAAKLSTANVDQPPKEKSTAESSNAEKNVQSSNLEKHLKSASCESTVRNQNSYFTFVETSSVLSCNSTPPSVNLFNAIVGMVLFVVFVWEILLLGSWC